MPSRKRPASGSTSRGRPKRARTMPSASTATTVPLVSATEPSKNIDLGALAATLTAAVTSAVQAAMQSPHVPAGKSHASESTSTTMDPVSVEEAVSEQLAVITSPTAGTKERRSPATLGLLLT